LGVGLRVALSGGAPGGWASDHREETAHNTGFNYIAIHAIAAQAAGATVTVFADGDQQPQRQSRRKSLASSVGSFARWKSTYGADDRETDPLPITHPLVRLLKRPNPYESGANFRYRQAQQIRLTGTCLIWNVPSLSGPTCERYVIPTAMASPVAPTNELPRGGWRISPVVSRYTPIVDDGYVEIPSWYRILGKIIDARQVQMIRLPHAWYLDDGQSPLSAGAKWVDAGEAVDTARYHQLKNGIDPSIVWNLPPDVSPDQDEIDRVQSKISTKYGGPENVGRVMVAQSGTTITPLSTSPKEMCYTEGFHDFKAAILALHQTPPVAVGLQEPGAYAAYNASMKAWRHAAVQPLCDMLAESDTEHLAPQFGTGLTVEIESDTVDDTDLIETQLRNDLDAKVRTKNEWRAVRGMPPLPGAQGDELVGTDSAQSSNQAAPVSPNYSGNSLTDSADIASAEKKTHRLTETALETSGEQSSLLSTVAATDSPIDAVQSSTSNHAPDSGQVDDSENDDSIRAKLIAEILYGLYGDSVFSALEAQPETDTKAFDPNLHPRGERGRFVKRGSAEAVAAARALISRVLSGETFARSESRVLEALRLLTRAQLESLHREHGVAPPPRLRDHLVESVWSRLCPSPDSNGANDVPPTSGKPAPASGVDVYVQHPDELNRILNRKMSREEWGQIVGAQPGARVHVFKRGLSSVEIAVEHPDYRARRIVTPTEIINSEIDVVREKQGNGIATRIIEQQVKAAKNLGFKAIRCTALGDGEALRDPSSKVNTGYYTWARLGFDGPIAPLMRQRMREGTEKERATVADFEKRFSGVKLVSEMMKTKERRDWWLKYGGEFEGTFTLKSDSKSSRVLEKYLAEKRKKAKSKSWGDSLDHAIGISIDQLVEPAGHGENSVMADNADSIRPMLRGENPDPLTPEDEEILDRIWDEIGRETGVETESNQGFDETDSDV
jgi:hypothetical protein